MESLILVKMYMSITTSVNRIQGTVFDMYDEDKVWMTEQKPNWCPIKKEVKISQEVACHDGDVCW